MVWILLFEMLPLHSKVDRGQGGISFTHYCLYWIYMNDLLWRLKNPTQVFIRTLSTREYCFHSFFFFFYCKGCYCLLTYWFFLKAWRKAIKLWEDIDNHNVVSKFARWKIYDFLLDVWDHLVRFLIKLSLWKLLALVFNITAPLWGR